MAATVVVKIGTSSVTQAAGGQLALATLAALAEQLTQLRASGYQPILVSSGAVGVGCARLGMAERPQRMPLRQAVAAVGQGRLMRVYDDFFANLQQPIAQVLLARGDLIRRNSYLNTDNTLRELLELGVIPIVNENDTTAVEELKFGDNDTLSALVASLVEAEWLLLLTDVDGLYSADPRQHPDAQPLAQVDPKQLAALQVEAGSAGSVWGTGGMATKLAAARIATDAGVRTVITNGRSPQNLARILAGEAIGTQFEPLPRTEARKRWIAHGPIPQGTLHLDRGAVAAICERGKSLLAAGITAVEGEFDASAVVRACDPQGNDIARGIANYSSREICQIAGQRSAAIPGILGYARADTVIHRDNLVVTAPEMT